MLLDGNENLESLLVNNEQDTDDTTGRLHASANHSVNQSQIQSAFRTFLRCLCNHAVESQTLLILFLDDLQWADTSSLELISALTPQQENKSESVNDNGSCWLPNFAIVGAYRSNMVSLDVPPSGQESKASKKNNVSDDPLSTMIRQLTNVRHDVKQIQLGGLSLNDLGHFIGDSLDGLERTEVLPLTQAVYSKTRGNVFYTMQAMEELVRQNALYYDMIVFRWQWVPELQDFISDDVVQMVGTKLTAMPLLLRKVLAVASKIQSNFDLDTLVAVCCSSLDGASNDATFFFGHLTTEDLLNILEQAVYEGFLLPDSANSFSFGHDRILQAAESFFHRSTEIARDGGDSQSNTDCLDPDIYFKLMLHIGKVLENQGFIFTAARHLNNVPRRYYDTDAKLESMVRLNLEAAQFSFDVAAFGQAAQHADLAVSFMAKAWLLPSQRDRMDSGDIPLWKRRYVLSLDSMVVAAQSHQQTGHVEKMEGYCRIILAQDDTLDESLSTFKFQASYTLAMGLFYGTSRYEEARSIILDLLEQSGCHFPKREIIGQLWSIPLLLNLLRSKRKWASQQLRGIKIMSDPQRVKCMKLLEALSAICYLMNDTVNLTLLIFYGLDYTRRYGASVYSSRLVGMVCLFFSGPLNDLQGAALYANYSLRLLQKVNHQPSVASTFLTAYAFGLCWTTPYRDLLVTFKKGFVVGRDTGDFENATWCIFQHLVCQFLGGLNLNVLEADVARQMQIMEERNRKTQALFTKSWWKLVLKLIGRPRDHILLDVDNKPGDSQMILAKLFDDYAERIGLLFLGNFDECSNLAWRDGNAWNKASTGHLTGCLDAWASALSYVAAARHGRARFRYRREAKRMRATIKRWTRQGNPNTRHLDAFLDAEYQSLRKTSNQSAIVSGKYQSAVDMALEGGYIQDAALANERWGHYLLNIPGQKKEAMLRLKDSMRLFSEWGASGIVARMRVQYADVLSFGKQASRA